MSWHGISSLDATISEFKTARHRFFRYRYETGIPQKVALALGFAALTGIAAQIRIPLPFTPVPITLQTFAVLLCGIALGMRWGGLSQALYIAIGVSGVPWFNGMQSGIGHILGPTGGYIVGFVFAAALVGYVIDRFEWARGFPQLLGVLLVANFMVIYGVGLPWLYGWLTLIQGSPITLFRLLAMGLFPFIAGDLVKLVGAAIIGKVMIPDESFGPEDTAT